jgi:hypothetical protein
MMPKNNMVLGLKRYEEVFAIPADRNLAPSSVSARFEDFVSNYRHHSPLRRSCRVVVKRGHGAVPIRRYTIVQPNDVHVKDALSYTPNAQTGPFRNPN